MPLGRYPQPTAVVQHVYEAVTERLLRSYPIRDLPLNIRPGMMFVTATWLLLLGVLGMAPLPELALNDKALHFFGLGFATFLLYFIVEVPDGPARRVWYIRRAPLLISLVLSFFFGGIISEFVQSLLPWKEFQWGDIVANLLGSTLFLYVAHLLHLRTRRRAEISTLYQPLSSQSSSTYRDAQGRQHAFDSATSYNPPSTPNTTTSTNPAASHPNSKRNTYPNINTTANSRADQPYHHRAGSNIWEEESEGNHSGDSPISPSRVFDIGDDGDDETPTADQGHDRSKGDTEQLV